MPSVLSSKTVFQQMTRTGYFAMHACCGFTLAAKELSGNQRTGSSSVQIAPFMTHWSKNRQQLYRKINICQDDDISHWYCSQEIWLKVGVEGCNVAGLCRQTTILFTEPGSMNRQQSSQYSLLPTINMIKLNESKLSCIALC